MKLHQLVEMNQENSTRKDRKLAARLKIIDSNIEMFSKPVHAKNADTQKRIQRLKDGKELLQKFYAGKIEQKEVPYEIWDLTSSMPAWGTYGT
jgi:hypothetical protein